MVGLYVRHVRMEGSCPGKDTMRVGDGGLVLSRLSALSC